MKHRLVNYVKNYNKAMFASYMFDVMAEMDERHISFQKKYYDEVHEFCKGFSITHYPQHNDRYLKQCYYNLQEKADRGIISEEEWEPIEEFMNKFNKEKAEEVIYVLPEIEVILPSEKIKGVQSVKIKLKNSAKKEILIYPISIDFKDNLLYIALSANKAKMVQDGKEFLMNGKEILMRGES